MTTFEERKQAALARKKARTEGGLDLMDGILDAMQAQEEAKVEGKAYPRRDEIPDAYLEYADWFVKATGLEPDKKCLGDWLAEFSYWTSKGLTIDSLQKALTERDLVYRPGTLTSTAIAIQAKKRATFYEPEIYRAAEVEEKQYTRMPADLKAKLDAKLKQDRVGSSKHHPRHIGSVMKGMDNG